MTEPTLSTFQTISLTVNILLGSGFFAIPLSVQQTNVTTAFIVTLVICILMTYTCISEASYTLLAQNFISSAKPPEVTVTAKTLFGRRTELLYLFVLSISIFGAMISYTMLYSDSLSSIITGSQSTSHDSATYLMCVLSFLLITTPLSLAKVEEQVWLQTASFILRIVLLTIMSATALIAKYTDRLDASFPSIVDSSPAPVLSFSAAVTSLLGTISFSLFLNSTLPTMLASSRDHKNIGFITTFAMFLVSALIFLLGVAISYSFGDKTASPANILWTDYKLPFATCDSAACVSASKCVEVLILFFPALDVLSIYSVNVIILTNNIMEGMWGMEWRTLMVEGAESTPLLQESEGAAPPRPAKNLAQYERGMLFAVNGSPILVALLLPGFSKAIVFTGGISLLLCLVFPAIFAIKSLSPEFVEFKEPTLLMSAWNMTSLVDNKLLQYIILVVGSGLTSIILVNTMI